MLFFHFNSWIRWIRIFGNTELNLYFIISIDKQLFLSPDAYLYYLTIRCSTWCKLPWWWGCFWSCRRQSREQAETLFWLPIVATSSSVWRLLRPGKSSTKWMNLQHTIFAHYSYPHKIFEVFIIKAYPTHD